MSVATNGSSAEFDEFVQEHGLEDLHAISDLERPVLISSMLDEHRVSGVPSFLAIRPDGQYKRFVGWGWSVRRGLASFLN